MTGQDVFDAAMALMDEVTSARYTADTTSYGARAVALVNTLVSELYPLSDTFSASDGGARPIAAKIAGLSENLNLDGYLCTAVLPYGLAAQFLAQENPQAASFCQQRYEELTAKAARSRPMEWEVINDAYGLNEYDSFGSW